MLVVIISVAIIILLIIWFTAIYNKYQTYIIRINEAENFIDNTLRKRYDLLNKAISIIKRTIATIIKSDFDSGSGSLAGRRSNNLNKVLFINFTSFHG